MVRSVIIGHGSIGKALEAKIDYLRGWDVFATVSRLAIRSGKTGEVMDCSFQSLLKTLADGGEPAILFLAIPTQNGGTIASEYIWQAIDAGIPIVTCEKGALSHNFAEFSKHLDLIGYSATVGGGTRILPTLRERVNGRNDVEMHGVVNGTLNFIWNEMDHAGASFGIAVEKAQMLGYAEPGSSEGLAIVNGEMQDTVMKTAIIFNIATGTGTYLSPEDVSVKKIDKDALSRLIREASVRRYIVSFFPPEFEGHVPPADDIIGGFSHYIDGWSIVAGFQKTNSNPLFGGRLPMGANNGIITCEGKNGEDGIYVLGNGPGAGPKPTTASMLSDAWMLLKLLR